MTNTSVFRNETDDGEEGDYTGFTVQIIPYVVFINIIVGFGLLGNIINIVVMVTPSMRRFSFATYLIILAISDSIVLINIAVEDTKDHIYNSLHSMMSVHISFCKFWSWVFFVCLIVSPWTLAALTFDRFATIVLHRYRERICRWKVALIICAVIFGIAVVMVSPAVHAMAYVQDDERLLCDTPDMKMQIYLTSLSVIMMSTLPVLFIVCLNGITVTVLCKSIKKDSSVDEVNIRRLTISLVLVSVLSAVALIPFSVVELVEYIYILSGAEENMTQLLGNLWMLFNVIRLINYAMNFYVLLIFSTQFRQSLRGLCRCLPQKKRIPTSRYEESTARHTEDGLDNLDMDVSIKAVHYKNQSNANATSNM